MLKVFIDNVVMVKKSNLPLGVKRTGRGVQ